MKVNKQMATGFAVGLMLLMGTQAQAERWILKNPKIITADLQEVNRMQLGANTYVVVEKGASVANFSLAPSLKLRQSTRADAAFPDAKIFINAKKNSAATSAWHVDSMKFAEIPHGLDGSGVVLAVLDTGVSIDHSALANHIWTNNKEIAGNGIDDDHNGYADDVHGYNFDANTADPMDDNSHGTHCSGIIAADLNSENGARGVAPGVKIMAIKVIGNNDAGFLSGAALGVKYAVDNGARILSNSWRIYQSWSGYYNEEGVKMLDDALDYTDAKGAIFVAAAGNESANNSDSASEPIFPAGMQGHPSLFVVAASNQIDDLADFSNYGKINVQVAAPGEDIMSTVLNNQWDSYSGTSMATPLVAGALALGLQKGYTSEEAMAKLIDTSDRTKYADKVLSGGVINILRFLQD